MKLNGISNIITDNDITLTGNKNLGKSLSSVIKNDEERIDILEQNVKFLYEHGGIGGGTGSGGGGSTTKWKLKATLGNIECVSGGTIGLPSGKGSYILHVWTSGGSGTYSVTYSYGNNTSAIITLSAENAWSTDIKVDLQDNGILSISATDGSISKQITGVSYVVEPYKFNSPVVVSSINSNYSSDIFVEDAIEMGVFLKSRNYAYVVDGQYTYEWYYDNVLIDSGIIEESDGDLVCDITEYMTNENAKAHFYKLKINILIGSSLEPVIIEYNGSFNLIPTTLFLKLAPTEGEIFYDDDSTQDPYIYSINKTISLKARIYKGKNASNEPGTLSWTIYENGVAVETNRFDSVKDGRTYNVSVSFSTVGWNYIVFSYSLGGELGTPVIKYFYCESIETSYNWFLEGGSPNNRCCYVAQEITTQDGLTKLNKINWSGLNPSNPPLYIQKLASDQNPTELSIDYNFAAGEQMINIGIQYSDINNSKNPLLILYDDINKTNETIKIFQNKIVFGNLLYDSDQECTIFLHKENNYDPDDRSKYHLLSICISHTGTLNNENNPYYEIDVYFDGILEACVPTKAIASRPIYKVDLMPGNFAINQFDISCWILENGKRKINDININWYWNSYKSRTDRNIYLTPEDTLILNSLFDSNDNSLTYDIENQLIKVRSGFAETVASNVNVPTLVLECPLQIQYSEGQKSIFEWLNHIYIPDQADPLLLAKVTTNVYYSPGKNVLSEIKIPESFGTGNNFTISIQGTSTVGNKSKNFTLRLNTSESLTSAGETILFSPNYDKENSDTFLPEQAFTLKADVVDSSHTNNTAMGKFINENNNWAYGGNINAEERIKDHVKQCLEGFATLVFLNVTYRENDVDYVDSYYLGIYNFNLGRDSYFNLGYCDLSQLHVQTFEEQSDSYFKFCKVGTSDGRGINPVPGFIAAEVQENSAYWDFSQYHLSILFPINTSEKSNFMFGDVVNATEQKSVVEPRIQEFVKSVAAAGGYIFERLGKTLRDNGDENGEVGKYHVPNTVSDYKIQHIRTYQNNNPYYSSFAGEISSVSEQSLLNCIVDDDENEIYSKLNYDSAVYYYTTCMVFGLIDSVEKNLNIKTWTANDPEKCQMGLYFYDMDTCLGKDNSGHDVSYFAFSDFWKSKITKYDSSGNVIDENDSITEADRIVNEGCDILRDCFLPNTNVKGYDTPSSYLFAIPKYAKAVIENLDTTIFPQQVYARWRALNGPLVNADAFIDRYFASNFNNIPECLINLNYRNKYLYDFAEDSTSLLKANSFHGRGVEYTRDWLSGRLHILDAYFNIGGSDIEIIPGISEPKHTVSVSNNPDIYILSDIFTDTVGGAIHRDHAFSFTVSADDYSPLFVRLGSSYRWYLFENSDIQYETYIPIQSQLTTFGGSQLWRTLNTINGFVDTMSPSENFIFNSKIIDSIEGTEGAHTANWLLDAPSVKTITLISPNYSGTLNISNQFPSLSSVNISNSGISLVIDEATITHGGITTINASNLRNSSRIILSNCNKLTSCSLANSRINECVISPLWTNTVNFSNIYAKSLTLSAPTTSGNLTINNNSVINSLTFSNMENVTISSCANLVSVKCNDTTTTPLRNLILKSCNSLTSLEIRSNVLEVLDLRGCTKLEEIKLHGSDFSHLKILNVSNTLLKKIVFDDLLCEDGILDFRKFTLLAKSSDRTESYLDVSNNKNLRSIQFDTGGPIYLHFGFSGCENLERLYGIFYINCSSCFNHCNKFSVHGADLTNLKWNNKNIIKNNRVQHPRELHNSPETYKPTAVGLTSMFFNGNYAASAFSETNCTIFDMYYLLWNCTPSITSLNYMFYLNKNTTWGRFSWTSSADNSPNRLMFQNCGSVENMGSTFFVSTTNTIRFFSPEHDEFDNITSDNGLFSPLVNLKTWSYAFYTYHTVADRFIFRRTSGNYKITSINRCLDNSYIVDDVNTVSFANSTTDAYVTGNLNKFFDNLQELSGVVSGLLYRTNTINFSTISNIPNAINTLRNCFVCSYGTGEIDFNEYFNNNTALNNIYQSFIANLTKANNTSPFINLTNDTFEIFNPRNGYSGLINFGYDNADDNYNGNTYSNGSLTGIKRILPNDVFPWNIFEDLIGLKMMSSLFRGCAPINNAIDNLKLPGNLFTKNTVLENCSGLFYDIKYPYTISPTHDIFYDNDYGISKYNIVESENTFDNFINCRNLKDVSYLFGATVSTSEEKEYPALTGMIPNNLFWHGATVQSVSMTGANERTEILDENDQPTGEYDYSEISETLLKISVNSTITNMEGCFQACNCSAYEKFKNDGDVPYFEDNPNWSPFLYIKNNKGKWISNTNYNTQKYTAIWIYDGRNKFEYIQNNNIENLDFVDWNLLLSNSNRKYIANAATWRESGDSIVQVRETFMCPPDLLRFCTSSANVSKLFNGSGLYGMNSVWQVSQELNHDKYAYGIEGRICPYLLKPVYNTNSVEKMFSQCKRLSFIQDYELDKDILIPDDFFKYATKVSNLKSMFAYMVQPHKLDMRNVFSKLTQSLEINNIFFNNYWSANEEQTLIEEVFRKNTITSLEGCFRIAGSGTNDSQPRDQHVKFKNIFKNNVYNTSMYADNSKFSYAFFGYRRNYPDFTEETTLANNTVTNNYITIV